MRLLVVCPTRSRVDLCKRMLESFCHNKESDGTEIVLGLDADDPELNGYLKIGGRALVCRAMTTTEIINSIYAGHEGFDFYSVTNDDFIYQTPGWDLELCKPGRISYGDDLVAQNKIPTTSVICGEIIRALGWLQMPGLTHLYGDMVIKHLGEALGILDYYEDIVVEHCHYLAGKGDRADYAKSNSKEMYDKDQKAFRSWRDAQAKADVAKVRVALSQMRRAG